MSNENQPDCGMPTGFRELPARFRETSESQLNASPVDSRRTACELIANCLLNEKLLEIAAERMQTRVSELKHQQTNSMKATARINRSRRNERVLVAIAA